MGAWRKHAEIELRGDVTVSVRLHVPLLIPGFKSPLKVGSTADTVLEDGDLSDRQGRRRTRTTTARAGTGTDRAG